MTGPDIATADIDTLLQALTARTLSARDLVDATLARIAALDTAGPALRAITHIGATDAYRDAAASDARRARGVRPRLLEGIPVLVKDNIEVAGWPTRAGSLALDGLVAATDAAIVTRLRAAGAIVVGKTAMHELACGITGASSLTGFARNPHALDRSPGGSSSGAGVAVAAGYVALAIGTDTAGSVQIPAAVNGLYGLRATRGALPLDGIVPLSPTQDMPGPITRHAADLERAFAALTARTLTPGVAGAPLAIGRLVSAFESDGAGISDACDQALAGLAAAGASWRNVALDGLHEQLERANVIAYEFDAALRRFLAARPTSPCDSLAAIRASGCVHPQLAPVLAKRDGHPGTDSPGYRQALAAQAALRCRLDAVLNDHGLDVLAYPTVRQPPVERGGLQPGSNGLIAPVAGLPGLNLPAGRDADGLPVGLHLLARADDEATLLRAARQWSTHGHGWQPPAAIAAALAPTRTGPNGEGPAG